MSKSPRPLLVYSFLEPFFSIVLLTCLLFCGCCREANHGESEDSDLEEDEKDILDYL